MIKLAPGEQGRFKTSCGLEIAGVVVEATDTGYVVDGGEHKSNLHEDGLFRFTLTWLIDGSTGLVES